MKEIIFTENAPKPFGSYSQAVKSNGFVFVSGQIPYDVEKGVVIREGVHKETKLIMKNIETILNAAGSSLDNVVKITVYLTDLEDIQFINEVFSEIFKENLPAREVIGVNSLPKDSKIEISAIATV